MGKPLGRFVLRGWGRALPSRTLDNAELGRQLGVDAESIASRTGIIERHVAGPGDSASTLGTAAARQALARAGITAEELDLVLLSTYTPDRLLCPTGPKIAHALGAHRAGAFDVNAACSGGVTALLTATSLIASGAFRNVLVVCADLTTLFVRPDDAKTRLVFGDGAAALVLERGGEPQPGGFTVLSTVMGADGSGEEYFHVPAGGSAKPVVNGMRYAEADHSVVMNGRAIFRFGVERGASVLQTLCERAGIDASAVRWVIPHQANLRMISPLIEKTGVPPERWFVNIQHYGNTASTSIPLALTELVDSGQLAPGDIVLLVAFGAGLTWCGLTLQAS